jgi:hypothetical protein
MTPNSFIGLLGLLVIGGMLADILSSKNTAHDVTALSNGWANVERAALHP